MGGGGGGLYWLILDIKYYTEIGMNDRQAVLIHNIHNNNHLVVSWNQNGPNADPTLEMLPS